MARLLGNAAWFVHLMLNEIHMGEWQIAKLASDGCLLQLRMARTHGTDS